MDNAYRIGQYTYPKDKQYGPCDTLKFNNAVSLFIGTINTVTPPLTIGLYGPWGSGKTTAIRGMVEQLQKDNLTLVFDAWKYRHEKNLILPLLCALQREYLSQFDDAKDSVKKVVTSVAFASLAGFLKHKTGIEIGDIRTSLEIYENGYKHYKKYDDHVAKIEQEYKEFIENLLKKTQKGKVIIFVDNLDRCLPDVVVNLLEDISSFLSIPDVPCVYVLAMDKENVIKAIKHSFPDFDGADYLEKIVQIPLKMPTPTEGRYHFMKRFEWAKKYDGEKAKSQKGDARDQIFVSLSAIDGLFGGDLFGNPRRVERIINKIIVLEASCLFFAEKSSNDISILIFLMLLGEYFPDVSSSLREDADYQTILQFLQISIDQNATPLRLRKEKTQERPSYNIKNEAIYNAYCDESSKFFIFLKHFSSLANTPNLPTRLKDIGKLLNYLG